MFPHAGIYHIGKTILFNNSFCLIAPATTDTKYKNGFLVLNLSNCALLNIACLSKAVLILIMQPPHLMFSTNILCVVISGIIDKVKLGIVISLFGNKGYTQYPPNVC